MMVSYRDDYLSLFLKPMLYQGGMCYNNTILQRKRNNKLFPVLLFILSVPQIKKVLNVFYQEVRNTIQLYSRSCLQSGTWICIFLTEIGLIATSYNQIFSYPSESSATWFSPVGSIIFSSWDIKLPGWVCPQERISRNRILRFSFEGCLYFFSSKVT